MFENATLVSAPAGKRVWTTCLGVTSQVFLVGVAVLAPMVFPQALPRTQLLMTLAPPVPPGPPPKRQHHETARVPIRSAVRPYKPGEFVAPAAIPAAVLMTPDPPDDRRPYVPGAGPGSSGPTVPGAFFSDLAAAVPVVSAVVKPADPPKAAPVMETVQRLQAGGRVQLGRLLRRVEPAYPYLAKTSHTSGAVVLECIVGTDGRVKDVRVVSGNPLLVNAARDAVLQWVYEGSQLNGSPIEIVAQISVNFKLN